MTDAARGHDEALPGGVQELARELGDLLRGGLGLGLARLGALRELVPQRRLDRLFPLIAVDLAVAVRVQLRERRLEARRDQQVLEVLVAAVIEEVNHFFVGPHGTNNLSLLERPAPVPVDEAEGLASRVEELLGEFAVGRGRGPRPPLLLGLELLDALREATVDGLLPACETTSDERHETRRRTPRDAPLVGVNLAALIRVQDLQGLLQPRRVEQKLQVLLAARLEELDDFLRTARSVTRSFGCSSVCVCS